ncbi:MAG: glycosyltransferase, partial [Sulfitobacter sp.]|nr:glycosyltransferase [Sulfitobacter sp.]
MPAPITVIIPTLNAEHSLTGCLTALMEGVDAGLIRELIVSDGGSDDATRIVAEAWGAEIIEGAASRGGQLRRGCAKAKGDWLLVLHADTHLDQGWTAPVAAHLKGQKAGWFQLRFDSCGFAPRFVAGWANLRSRFGLPYGDQ